MTLAAVGLLGALVGGAVVWLVGQTRLERARSAERELRIRVESELSLAQRNLAEQRRLFEEAQARLENTFKALAADALKSSNEQFLSLARQTLDTHLAQASGDLELRKKAVEELVKPIHESLKLYQEKADLMEKGRQAAYGGVSQLLQAVATTQEKLRQETTNLVSALKQPNVRGRWGEITLRRVVELAGLSPHCDFTEQPTVAGEEGQLRPDLVVHLPSQRQIIVDAKAVLSAYLEALEAPSEEARTSALRRHASHLSERVKLLASKRYWGQFEQSAEFVVLFVPGDPFLSAAVHENPDLIEEALASRVVMATPSTLVAILKAVAYGWKQEQMAQNAREVADLGKKLYEGVVAWAAHLQKLREALFSCVEHFNAGQASLDRNVLSRARRMRELGVVSDKELPAIEPVDELLRPVEPPRLK
jgi:DNA recombination protein RmuC